MLSVPGIGTRPTINHSLKTTEQKCILMKVNPVTTHNCFCFSGFFSQSWISHQHIARLHEGRPGADHAQRAELQSARMAIHSHREFVSCKIRPTFHCGISTRSFVSSCSYSWLTVQFHTHIKNKPERYPDVSSTVFSFYSYTTIIFPACISFPLVPSLCLSL